MSGNPSHTQAPDPEGLLLCSRYAFPPNSLHFCGPEKQSELKGYIHSNTVHTGLADILGHFETLFPYLQLIASRNDIRDPYDKRVVEAYWIGNALLSRVPQKDFARHYHDFIKRKMSYKHKPASQLFELGFPHHTFHVMNIFMQTGHTHVPQTIESMDQCRIKWGKVLSQTNQVNSGKPTYVVSTDKLYLTKHDTVSLQQNEVISAYTIDGQYKKGDTVSLHWGGICSILTKRNLAYLKRYTDAAIRFWNVYTKRDFI